MWILIQLLKGYIFQFCTIVLELNFFLTPWGMIPRGVIKSLLKFEYLSENQTKIENILTHWSVAKAGSKVQMVKKNWRSKITLDCPFSKNKKFLQ